ncbi:hypothetical protein HYU06_02710 [Candidatus Woesearchaeota archaeon]|nr:hypothetical protein [Candidatus Woesearchaeota archaeon]
MEFLEQIQKDRKIAQDLVNNKIAADIGEAFKMIQEKRHMPVKIIPVSEQNINGSLKQSAQAQQPHAQTSSSSHSSQSQASQEQVSQISSDAAERLGKIEEFLQKFDKFFAKFYEDTNAKLNDFSKSINAVNSLLEEVKNRKIEQNISIRENTMESADSAAPSESTAIISNHQLKGLEESGVKQSTFRQKEGNYKPEDVSVEMIFNNSHNRLTKR